MTPKLSLTLRVDFNVPVLCDLHVELRDPGTGEVIILDAPVHLERVTAERGPVTDDMRRMGIPVGIESCILTYEGIYTREEGFRAESAQPEKLQRVLDLRKVGT